jgi:hypothetical protein
MILSHAQIFHSVMSSILLKVNEHFSGLSKNHPTNAFWKNATWSSGTQMTGNSIRSMSIHFRQISNSIRVTRMEGAAKAKRKASLPRKTTRRKWTRMMSLSLPQKLLHHLKEQIATESPGSQVFF